MELKINEYQLPEKILFNYEELKQELKDKVSVYTNLVYTDDQIKLAKSDKASLNKLKKALNDERIRREKEYLEPFNEFKTKVNEIIKIIDEPVMLIDKQIKEYEDKQKQDKLTEIKNYFTSLEKPFESLNFEQIYNSKWLNATTSMKSIQEDINNTFKQINNDLVMLQELPQFGFEAQEIYKDTLDVNKAINEAKRISEIAKAKAKAEVETHVIECGATGSIKTEVIKEDVAVPEVEGQAKIPYEKPVEKQWVNFSALLSTDDAIQLKEFFNSRNIEFKAI